ncbi:MAG: HNH endonuclease signature motif containing protein [Corynebacterium glucuronolyticum]|nr:HNH endonuclease [Corynebacterium glucuronolyticum]MDD7586342.1 HNH endonuclease signature motif containing protein [Mycobacteriaceae bacterium]MDY5834565.1 HNH endonuclease signature motif containing protein [Corynebacterium glucuronolyticum]
MTALTDCAVLLSQAMVIAGEAFGMSKKALVRAGYDPTTAHTIKKLADIYYGRCGAPRKQERTREKATTAGCSFASLQAIERFVAKLPKKHAWTIREALVPFGRDITQINAEGARLIQTYTQAENPEKRLTYRAIPNSTFATLTLTAESSRVKQIYDRAQATDKNPADGLIKLALAANDGELPPVAIPLMVIPFTLPYVHVKEVERGKFVFSMTNGATISGEEIVRAKLAEERLVALVSPLGPRDFGIYRIEMTPESRYADPLERVFQSIRNPVCAWPECSKPATKSQIHHMKPVKHGGKTVSENLMVLCDYHNGINDDDLDKPKHGHMVRIDGLEYWKPAFGGPLKLNMNPCAQGGAVRLARMQLGIPIDPSPPG